MVNNYISLSDKKESKKTQITEKSENRNKSESSYIVNCYKNRLFVKNKMSIQSNFDHEGVNNFLKSKEKALQEMKLNDEIVPPKQLNENKMKRMIGLVESKKKLKIYGDETKIKKIIKLKKIEKLYLTSESSEDSIINNILNQLS